MVGEVLADRYEVEELVGAGGMSSVYRAHDTLLDRKVALKVMHLQYGEDPEYVERFRREARSVAALSHPNVVTVIDRGEHEGRQFIVFEYVDGENLKQLIRRRGPAPVASALELTVQVASALSFAHRQGLVHRDVKPQNVLLNGDGTAKVTDFGIARSLDVQHGVTQTGTVLGTSDYIAPEQAQGLDVDEQTDVYALGVVSYELLTGDVPFPGESFVAVAMRHINDPPPPLRDKRPDVPPRVEAAVQRAMAKDPRDRFPTMAAFADELESCLAELQATQVLPGRAAPPRPRRARRRTSAWPIVFALLVVLVAGGVAGYIVLRGIPHSITDLGKTHHAATASAIAGTVPLHAITAFDPYGSPPGQEHNADAPKATDGIPSTYWATEHYNDAPSLDKPGVGLILDAGHPVQLRQLGLSTATPGFVAQIEASDDPTSFTQVVGASQTTTSVTRYSITGGPYRYYLIWITRLGPNDDQAFINEVKAD
jgi:serine/threonine-protein kinase